MIYSQKGRYLDTEFREIEKKNPEMAGKTWKKLLLTHIFLSALNLIGIQKQVILFRKVGEKLVPAITVTHVLYSRSINYYRNIDSEII